jgi:acyl-homoserine lactone acylase PvdQ
VRVLQRQRDYTIDKVIAAGYDTYLTAFEVMIPALINAFENTNIPSDSSYAQLKEAIAILKHWDFRSSKESIATTLAIEWAQRLTDDISVTKVPHKQNADIVDKTKAFIANAPAITLLPPLSEAIETLQNKYGDWRIAWGDVNRFQRISGDVEHTFSDNQKSLPVPFVSSQWGMLPSYVSRYFGDSKKRYGTGGNSFICAVEFGIKIKAKSLLAGGQTADPSSRHFKDQAEMYTKGEFKDVLFYKDDVEKHGERTYHPGEF